MKASYFYFLAAAVLLAGCNKEVAIEQIQPEGAKTVLTVGIAPQTKTQMQSGLVNGKEHEVFWSQGDQIRVNGVASDALESGFVPAKTARFTIPSTNIRTPYYVVYPASIATDTDDEHVTLPAVQTYKAGGFADGMFPMAGYSADGNGITLNYLCSIVKISVMRATATDADADNIVSVRFQGKADEQVSGVFTIDYSNATLTGTSSAAEDKVVKVVKSQATSTTTAIDYYIVVPARTYASGFDVIVQDSNSHIMTKSKSGSWNPEAGKLYVMPAFDFKPTGTELGVEISSAAEFVQFAKDYNEGKYIGQEDLVVTLTNNIDFSVGSANEEFANTGGIGTKKGEFETTEDNYFYGVFNGKGKTISNYKANIPLFKYTRSATVIEDFTMDETCSLTFTHPTTVEGDFGAIVGYNKGTIKGVTVKANLSLASGSSGSQHTAFGGIVGNNNNGTIDDCTFAGNITVPSAFQEATGKKLMIGGIAGYVSNASGTIKYSHFEGTICNEGQALDTSNQSNPYLIIGGIVGYGLGSINYCDTKDNPTVDSAYSSDSGTTYLKGTIVNKTTIAYCCAVGGIIGENLADGSVSSCTNNATVINTLFKNGNDNTKGRRLRVGGIAGKNVGSITGSTNNAALTLRSNPFFQYLGGITGWNTSGTITGCTNNGALEIAEAGAGTNGPRYAFLGGIIGENDGTSTVSDVHNTKNLVLSCMENTNTAYARVGGVIGSNLAAIDGGTEKNITNSGNIVMTNASVKVNTPDSSNEYGFFLGGIAGWTSAAVSSASNEGNLDYNCTAAGVGVQYVYLGGVIGKVAASSAVNIKKCTNSGNVTFVPDTTAPHSGGAVYNYCYLGGIAGYANNASIQGDNASKCTNSGIIKGGEGVSNQNSTTPQNSFWVGGIVGYLTGDSSVSYCDLSGSGEANNNHWCNRGSSWKTGISTSMYTTPPPACGGIVGEVVGTSTKKIAISNCSIPSTAKVWARRGACAGIVGISQYAEVSNCSAAVNISQGYWNGGIVGAAYGTSVSGCNFTGTSIGGSNESGGIVAYLDVNSSIDNCNSYATTLTTSALYGGIAGASVKGSSISNSHCKTGKQICSDTNFTDGDGNAANL